MTEHFSCLHTSYLFVFARTCMMLTCLCTHCTPCDNRAVVIGVWKCQVVSVLQSQSPLIGPRQTWLVRTDSFTSGFHTSSPAVFLLCSPFLPLSQLFYCVSNTVSAEAVWKLKMVPNLSGDTAFSRQIQQWLRLFVFSG